MRLRGAIADTDPVGYLPPDPPPIGVLRAGAIIRFRMALFRPILALASLAIVLELAVQEEEAIHGDRLVKVELLADRAAVRPGETFTIAVKLGCLRIQRSA